MKTVAAISFLSNHSLSMDAEAVNLMEISPPMQIDGDIWCCELLIRTANGTIALQLTSDDPAKLDVRKLGLE